MKTISVYNFKGGIGKSTISAPLADGLSRIRKKVLISNLDGQNNSLHFLTGHIGSYDKTLYDLIVPKDKPELSETLIKITNNLYGLASSNMQDINADPFILPSTEKLLKEAENLGFDYVIFDCSPQESNLNMASLYYADAIIMPVQLQYSSIEAISLTYDYFTKNKLDVNKIKIVVPNMLDKRTAHSKGCLSALQNQIYKDTPEILAQPIPQRTSITDAGQAGIPIYEYDPDAAEPFFNLVKKVVKIIG